MKIFILPINKRYIPENQLFKYPQHNMDYGVEQDFFNFLLKHPEFTVKTPDEADWHYLPVYWTRWHLNHEYGKTGLAELQQAVSESLLDEKKTFTICQYDDGPIVELGSTKIFLASRKTANGIDIPLLCSPHRIPLFKPSKKYLASFIGRSSTYSLRNEMLNEVKKRNDVFIFDGDKGTVFFVRKTLQSKIALCPRGYGGSSFRFFEAMQLGAVPFLIGDIDTRPFKNYIDWEAISFYLPTVEGINTLLDSIDSKKLGQMGQQASKIWAKELTFQQWCKYVIMELNSIERTR